MVGVVERSAETWGLEPRHDVLLRAELRGYRMPPVSAAVLDVSAGSAILRTATKGFRVGDEVVLALGSVQSVATIVWLRSGACGITFHRRLDPFTLDGIHRMPRH